jgi:hypothetical protein
MRWRWPSSARSAGYMFCPKCKAEYREGFTRCTECNAALVASLPTDQSVADKQDLAVAWRGTDPSAFSAALAELQGAGIPSYQISDHDQLTFELAIPRPQYKILVRKEDLQVARDLVEPFGERPALANARDIWKGRSEFQDGEEQNLQESLTENTSTVENPSDDVTVKFDPKNATTLVWSGEDPDMKAMLLVCLRENRIDSVVDETDGKSRIRVLPVSEARAREIIREVVEATPSE